jgi:hypothetical protein
LRLHDLVEKAARQGTVCFSFVHVLELYRWAPFDRVLERARWMDHVGSSWIKTSRRAENEELAWWLRCELDLARERNYSPLSPALLGVLTLPSSQEHVSQLLSDPTIAGFIRNAYSRRSELPDAGDVSSKIFASLHHDRSNLPAGTTEQELDRVTTRKFEEDIRRRSADMSSTVVSAGDASTLNSVVEAANRLLERSDSIPLNRLSHSVIHELGRRIAAQPKSESTGFRRRYGGSAFDIQHLSGAVYCDVFTCDAAVDRSIGDFRTARGLARQLSVGESRDPELFVSALEAQLDGAISSLGAG